MKRRPISLRVSVRIVLLTLLAVLGGAGLITSLQHTGASLSDYRQNRIFAERGRIAAQLLTAGQHLAYERGRSAVVLRGAERISAADRDFIDERRRLADAALEAALKNTAGLPQAVYAELVLIRQELGQLRLLVDQNAILPLPSRDKRLAERWFGAASGFIGSIQRAMERLVGENRPGDKTTRLTLLSASMLQLRMTAGGEASLIAQALAAGQLPARETLYSIHEMRGQEEQLWHDIERLTAAVDFTSIQQKVGEIRKHHLAVFRPLQDQVLAELAARGRLSVPLEKLTAASLPVLDGISDLMIRSADQAVQIGIEGEADARSSLVLHVVWSVLQFILLVLALRYVVRYVVAPLEQVDLELRRLGALPVASETGSEIERLKVSALALERSIVARSEAQRIAHVGSWEMNLVDNVLTWSDEIYRIFDVDPVKFGASYEAFMEVVHPDDRQRVDSTYKETLEKHQPFEIEHRLLLPDGRIKYVLERCETVYGENGKPLRSIGTVQDITERKRMEAALQESEARSRRDFNMLQSMLESASGVSVFALDRNYRYLAFNKRHRERAKFLRNTDIEVGMDMLASLANDEFREFCRKGFDLVLSGQSVAVESREEVVRDGVRVIEYNDNYGSPIIDENGEVVGITVFAVSLNARKEAEQKLKEALEFTEGIINAIPDILFEMDRDGRYLNVWTQDPDLLAEQREMLLGKTVHEVLSPENAAAAMEAIREADEKGYAQGKDIPIDLPHGRRWFAHTLSRKPGGTPGVATFLALSRDITERKLLEESLAEREQAFRSLAESSPDFIVRYDREGRHCYLNNNLLSKLGLAGMEEVLGKRPIEVWTDGRFSAIEDAAELAIASGEMQSLEMTAPDENGGLRYTQISVVPERGASGDIIGTIAFGSDVTAFREAERQLQVIADALQESEARYRYNYNLLQAIIESPSSSVAIYAIDREYRLLAFNSRFKNAAKRLWNAEIEPGMSVLDAIDTEIHREIFKQGAVPVLAGSHGYLESHEDRIEDGRTVREYHDNYGAPIYNDNGEVIGMTIFVLNTTERKEAELKLKEALEFTEGVINAIPDMLFEMDGEGRYLNIWTHTPELLTARKEALMGRTVDEMLSPEAAATVMEALREAGAAGVSFGKNIVLDLPQGKGWFELSVSKKTGGTFLVLSRDISVRKRMESELKASRNFLDSVINAVPDPIFVKDRQHRWVLLNSAFCAFIGHSREMLYEKSDYDFFPVEQAEVFWEKDELVFNSGEVNLNEESFTSADGVTHHIQTKKTPFVSADGRQMLVGVIRDISARKQFEAAREAALAEAERLARQRSEFLAQMSHELRTPLNGILGYAQILGRDRKLDERQLAGVQVIRQSGEHLLTLINDILDFAKIDAGKMVLVVSDVELEKFLRTIAGILRVKADEKRLEFVCSAAPDLPRWIHVDEKRLRQVLLNLLSNAVKFTSRGRVVLRVECLTPGRLRFEVQDSGIGIAPDQLDAIFLPFEQVGDPQFRFGGTGLGLPISRQIVRLMGSDIRVNSMPGQGSTFWFELDTGTIAADVSAIAQKHNVEGYAGERRTILVADDVAENRAVAVRMLEQFGFRIMEAGNGRELLEQAAAHRPDLILTDSVMPVMDGLEAIRRLRGMRGLEAIPVIAVSASASSEDESHCLAVGANGFLPKPIELTQLLAQVGTLLKLDWLYRQADADAPEAAALVVPPAAEIEALYHFAQTGSMRDILQYAGRLIEVDECYRPFAERLRGMAAGYQTKAIVIFVEQYLNRKPDA